MFDEGAQVSDDHIMLSAILDRHRYTAKQLAAWTGRAQSTIYKYLSGELTIPSIIWRALYDRSLDCEIITLLTGTLPVVVVPLLPGEKKTSASRMRCLIKTRKAQLECEELVLSILENGEGDGEDETMIRRYRKIYPESVIAGHQLYQAITGGYEKGSECDAR